MALPITKPDGIVWLPTQTFGIPRGTAGRNAYPVAGIVLHCLEQSLERYDAILCQQEKLTKAHPWHSSMHYVVGQDGEIHQYVADANLSWGFGQYLGNQPAPYPVPGLAWLPNSAAYPGVTPDYYVINVGIEIGAQMLDPDPCCPGATVLPPQGYAALVHLLAWLAQEHTLLVDPTDITFHQTIDPAREDECVCADLATLLEDVADYCEPCAVPADHAEPEGEIVTLIGISAPVCPDDDGCMVREDAQDMLCRILHDGLTYEATPDLQTDMVVLATCTQTSFCALLGAVPDYSWPAEPEP